MKQKKLQPTEVQRIACPKCGELQVKIYPWASMTLNGPIPPCKRCQNSSLKSGVAQ